MKRLVPPRWSRAFLAGLLPGDLRPEVLADMDASWYDRNAVYGAITANRWYRHQVRASLRAAVAERVRRSPFAPTELLGFSPLPRKGDGLFTTLLQDLGYTLRWARHNPGFTAIVVATLALGIAANTATFSVVYGVLLSPLPYPDAGRIVRFYNTNDPDHESTQSLSRVELAEYLERADMFDALAGMDIYQVTLTGGEEPIRARATVVTRGFFDVFGVPAARGRTFTVDETSGDGGAVVVIGYWLWQRAFGGRDDVVGTDLSVDGRDRQIVGVMPAEFDFYPDTDVWLPMSIDLARLDPEAIRSHSLAAVAKLPAGVEIARAQEMGDRMVEAVLEQYPQHDSYHGAKLIPLSTWSTGSVRPMLLALLGAVAFMLLIVCANVAALLLARAEGRRQELAIRAALGAGRARLARQMLTESMTLAMVGGGLGVLAAYLVRNMVVARLASGLPRAAEVGISIPVLLFSLVVTVITGLLFGVLPTMKASTGSPGEALRGAGREGASRPGARGILVTGEVAMVVALLIGATLVGRSFVNLLQVQPGIEPDNVLSFDLELPQATYASHADVVNAFDALADRVAAVPVVETVGAVSWLPFADFPSQWGVEIDGVELDMELDLPDWTVVTGDYFQAVGIPLLAGRTFGSGDRDTGVIVTESAAAMYWPDRDPLGERLRLEGNLAWRTVVGVVGDYRNRGLTEAPRQGLYFPHAPLTFGSDWYARRMSFVLRTNADPLQAVPAVRDAIWSLDPQLPLGRLQPLTAVLDQTLAQTRLTLIVLAGFALLALSLGAVGIHGVVAQAVAAGQRDIGVRMALGAGAQRVLGEVVAASMKRIAIGLLIGLVAGYWLTRSLMASLLFGVTATDPAAWLFVVAVLGAVGFVATLIPARRALGVDPVVVMRAD